MMHTLDADAIAFIEAHPSAAMITVRSDGTPHAVRVGIAVVEGRLWSSGTADRRRTAHLRADPRSTLFVFDGEWHWLTMECNTRILDGPDAPELHVRMFQQMQAHMDPPPAPGTLTWFGRSLPIDEFRDTMIKEQRLIYEFGVLKSYGMYPRMHGA